MRREKHGDYKSRLYRTWCNMKGRCYRKSAKGYENYGGRGIKVCEEWKNSYISFRNWALKNGYDKNAKVRECTLDRIDVDGDYTPKNCRWINNTEQQNNKRNSHLIYYNGERKSLSEWARIKKINYKTLEKRVKKWGVQEAFSTPVLSARDGGRKRKPRAKQIVQYSINGEYIRDWDSLKDISRELGYFDTNIIACCKHNTHNSHGYIWRYKSEVSDKKYLGMNMPKCEITKRKTRAIPVLQYKLDGDLVKRWSCAKEAKESLGYSATNIALCCKGERKSYNGFIWKYEREVD